MKHDEFVDELQHHIEADSHGETRRTIHAVLETLGERIQADEAKDLAGPLPMEIDRHLLEADRAERFGWNEFVERVAERENADYPDAQYHAQAVMALVAESVPDSELQDVRANLPDEFDDLFELADAEAWT